MFAYNLLSERWQIYGIRFKNNIKIYSQNKREYNMNQPIQTNEYDALIKKIQRKRKIVIVLTIIAVLITIIACSPIYIGFLDKTVIDYKGINPVITVLLVLVIFFCELIAYAFVSTPLTTSMDIECDPEKHLTLNTVLNKQKNKNHIYAVDFIYMGNFEAALNYANKMVSGNKPAMQIIGLFNKARCEFFLGDFDYLKLTVKQYENALYNMKKIDQKTKAVYDKIQKTMNLLIAIADKDKEKICVFRDIEVWNNSKATQGYIHYLKGVAAYITEDKEEAIYRFMSVKENCEKTVLSKMAEQYLLNLK